MKLTIRVVAFVLLNALVLAGCGGTTTSPVNTGTPVTATPIPVGTTLYTYPGHSGYVVNAVAWSPDGKRIASASADGTVQVWDAATGGNVFTYPGHANSVLAVAWSPDGKRIASGSRDGTVQVWQAVSGSYFALAAS